MLHPFPFPFFNYKLRFNGGEEMNNLANFLCVFDRHAASVQSFSAILLFAVTLYYACITRKMQKLMAKQVIPDILILKSRLDVIPGKKGKEKGNFLECSITLHIDLCNQNSGNGSITSPIPIVKNGLTKPLRVISNSPKPIEVPGGRIKQEQEIAYENANIEVTEGKTEFEIEYTDNVQRKRIAKVDSVDFWGTAFLEGE